MEEEMAPESAKQEGRHMEDPLGDGNNTVYPRKRWAYTRNNFKNGAYLGHYPEQ
jgi:hypothetical protein